MGINRQVQSREKKQFSAPSRQKRQKKRRKGIYEILIDATTVSRFLPRPLSHPLIGYLIAILLQTIAIASLSLLMASSPTFRFPEAPLILMILLVALGWGSGPGMLATLVGDILFVFFILPPIFSLTIVHTEDLIGIFFYTILGFAISLLTGQTQAAMHHAERVASERATQLEAIIEAIADPLFIVDHQGLQRINQAARQLFGMPESQQADLQQEQVPPFELLDEQGQILPREHWPQTSILAGKTLHGPTAVEVAMRLKDGRIIILSVTGSPIRAANGSVRSAVLACRDVTERSLIEQERAQLLARALRSEDRFQRLFGAKLIGLVVADKDRITEANDAFLDMLGYTRGDLEAGQLHWASMTPLEYEHLNEQGLRDLQLSGECSPFEKEYFRKDGSRVPVLTGAVIIEHEPSRWITFVLDLTEHARLEKEAKVRARELEALFNAITDGIIVYDADGYIRQLNPTANAQLNRYLLPGAFHTSAYERANVVKPQSTEGIELPIQKVPIIRMLHGETIAGSEAQDVHIRTFENEDLWLNMSGTPLFDEQGHITGAISIARDVTERRRLEQRTHIALEALLEMAQVIVQGAAQGETDPSDTITHSRQLMQRLADLTQKVLGCHRLSFTQVVPETEVLLPLAVVGLPPEQEEQWWQAQEAQEAHLTDNADPALVARLRANEILLLDLTQPPYDEQPNPYGIREMLAAPMVLGTRLLGFLTLDYGGLKHTYTSEEMTMTMAVTKLAALAMERNRLQAEATLARANELAARAANRLKDEFIGIAGHELRTPMTTMKANLQLAERHLRRHLVHYDGETNHAFRQLLGFVERTERQLERQNRLIRDLLDVSRIESGHLELHLEACNLLTVLQEAIEDQREITPTRTIQLELPGDEAMLVMADCDRVSQVISNYLSNALKYSETDQPVIVRLTIQGMEACVSVQDYGPGLSSDEQQRIWDRFYRIPGTVVKSGSGVGLGLGLHISQIIIEGQKGKVGVESEIGTGSTFWFTLPLVVS